MHDGWERYVSPDGLLLYRGNPYQLTPPVLSLAGQVTGVWDRWGFLVSPPELRLRYCRALKDVQAPGAAWLAVALVLAQQGQQQRPRAVGQQHGPGEGGDEAPSREAAQEGLLAGLHPMTRTQLDTLRAELAAELALACDVVDSRQPAAALAALPGGQLSGAPGWKEVLLQLRALPHGKA